jgi:hypothetical protein
MFPTINFTPGRQRRILIFFAFNNFSGENNVVRYQLQGFGVHKKFNITVLQDSKKAIQSAS